MPWGLSFLRILKIRLLSRGSQVRVLPGLLFPFQLDRACRRQRVFLLWMVFVDDPRLRGSLDRFDPRGIAKVPRVDTLVDTGIYRSLPRIP